MQNQFFKFLGWMAKSFSGNDEVSSRRLTAFVITCCYLGATIRFNVVVTDPYYLLWGLIVHGIFVLLLFRIITMDQVNAFKNGDTIRTEKRTEISQTEKTEQTTT